MVISKRFEKARDPLVLIKGSREERRMKLIEKYRKDIEKRKAEMDKCMIIELGKQAAAKKSNVLEISDSDEDCVYLASNGNSVENFIYSRNDPVQRVSDWSQNVSKISQNNDHLMQNRILTNSQMSNKVKSTVPKRKIENEPSIATKKRRIFEEPTTEAPECRIHKQLIIFTYNQKYFREWYMLSIYS